ncbi:hypothetical protein TEA_024580 [Camellia sinensis var. sinensis]|uniref:Suppressor of forked domain-containing protein n=1 Tax=Camellia sinensis var. sinensis TaxID=542762 RepID=A0A4S4E3V9_CAMSN|nr:hypothetical protein TEA_024580 [Camellia sinensis var. sinensis]
MNQSTVNDEGRMVTKDGGMEPVLRRRLPSHHQNLQRGPGLFTEFSKRGIKEVTIRDGGSRVALLSFKSGEHMKEWKERLEEWIYECIYTTGFMKSMSGPAIVRPNINLEVVLHKTQAEASHVRLGVLLLSNLSDCATQSQLKDGADIASGPVWMEYITFLKSMPAQSTQEESQRMTAVRKAYQKAIVTPTHHVEQLWKDYENFENSVSRALAKGLVSEYQPKYNSARAVYREQKKYVDEIDWNMLAVPPSGSYKEELQWMAWKRFLAFEKGNPQRIDSTSANKRIAFTYEQCLMYLYHYPDIWYDYATWHAKSGAVDSAIKVFQRALKALPDSEMLKYAYAELEESRGAIQPAKKVYESLLGDGVNATALSHIQVAMLAQVESTVWSDFQLIGNDEHYIRFLRRTEGVEAARKYFLDARKSPNCTYHVFVAYAMMAFCLDKDPKVAHNVFEVGLKRFMHEPGYILE